MDEQGPITWRQPAPRERDARGRDLRGSRGQNRVPDWQDPASWGPSPRYRDSRDGRPPAPGGTPRLRWGELPGVLGVCVVIGGTAAGALVSAVTNSQPGFVLSAFLVVATVCAVLAVRPRSVYSIIPVPALAYLTASLMTGLAVNQNGTTLTALAVGAAQWIASGFTAMVIATLIAIVATIVRWPRKDRGPRRPPPPGRASRPRPPRTADAGTRPRRAPDRRPGPWADSVATAAYPDRPRKGRNG